MKPVFALCILLFALGCTSGSKKLPVLGNPALPASAENSPVIPPFSFTGQDNIPVTETTFKNHIYVADFIFLSCPTICPVMTRELKKVYDTFEHDPRVLFLSHTIDPEHDTTEALKRHSDRLGVDSKKWFFVTGEKDSIYKIAEEGYFSSARSDKKAPGGYIHSGGLLLIDTNRHIRGVYDGTNPQETERLINDIKILLQEAFAS